MCVHVPSLWIPGRVLGLNEIIELCKAHWARYRKSKRAWGAEIAALAKLQGFEPVDYPATFTYLFVEPDARRDPSNIVAGGVKFIEDGLQEAGLLSNDSQKFVKEIIVAWKVDPDRPGALLEVKRAEDEKEKLRGHANRRYASGRQGAAGPTARYQIPGPAKPT